MIRVGIVGLGHNGRAHLAAHRRVGMSEIVAICDANPERIEEVAKETGVKRAYVEVEELCAQPDIDAISINTGDPFHTEPFLAAMRHGKHVFVEKPVANRLEDIEVMVAAVRAADPKLKIAVGYILRFNPVFEAIHGLCRSGKLGRVYYLEGDYVHNLLYQAGQTDTATGQNWYLTQERPMVGGGSHPLDLLRWFSGAQIVEAFGYSAHEAFPAMREDDCQTALFRFDDGTTAKVSALYAPRMRMAPYYNLRLYGTMGTVERDQAALAKDADDVHPDFKPIEANRLWGHPYEPEIADWLQAIRQDHAPRCAFYDGVNSTAATLVAVQAIKEGKALPVPVYA